MTYVDGFVLAVPADKKEEFIAFQKESAAVFKKYGALRCVDNWGVDVPDGKETSFPLAVKKKEGETVVLSWCEWESKEAREAAMEKLAADPFFTQERDMDWFDTKRMIVGGFETILDE